jgi:hypothetical protein
MEPSLAGMAQVHLFVDESQVGISLTFFFHVIYFLDFKFMSDLLHHK